MDAITTDANPLCVLAGAGSGKTRVLTRRIAWRVREGTALSGHVTAVTFTRKAAGELRQRLAHLGLRDGVTAGTFHAIALSELRRLAAERQQAPPVVLPSKARLLYAVLEEHGSPSERFGGNSRGGGGRGSSSRGAQSGRGAPSSLVHELAAEIEWAKSRLVTPETYEIAAVRAGRMPPVAEAEVATIFAAYERERRRRRVLDFEDLLTECATELGRDPEFLASQRWRMRHFFVDEYQDINSAQLRLLRSWCGPEPDLCVVGDPNQAIYAWNGSDPEAIGRFGSLFPGGAVVELGRNYRSSPEVATVAGAVLARWTPRSAVGSVSGDGVRPDDPDPSTVASPSGPVPTVTAYASDVEEASGVADLVRRSRRPGRAWSQIAILARTNNQLAAFKEVLDGRGIPNRIVGEGGLLRRPHVAAALSDAYRLADGPALSRMATDLRSLGGGEQVDGGEDGEASRPSAGIDPAEAADLLGVARIIDDYLVTDAVPSGSGLRSFLDATSRGGDGVGVADAVELLTFHRAKGLEWPIVFVTGLEDGFVPIAHARGQTAHDEERRLLYVACTRAEEELHCSWARTRTFGASKPSVREPSPFLDAIERARKRLASQQVRTPASFREGLAASRRALGADG